MIFLWIILFSVQSFADSFDPSNLSDPTRFKTTEFHHLARAVKPSKTCNGYCLNLETQCQNREINFVLDQYKIDNLVFKRNYELKRAFQECELIKKECLSHCNK